RRFVARIVDRDPPAAARELLGGGGADAGRAAGDERGFHTVAIGVAGEPTAPGSRRGGAVRRKRLRPCARSQRASSVKYHSSPRWMPFLKMQCSCSGIAACGKGLVMLAGISSTAKLSARRQAAPQSVIHCSRRSSRPSRPLQVPCKSFGSGFFLSSRITSAKPV